MKVRDVIEKLNEKQKKSVEKCSQRCNILDMEREINIDVDDDVVKFLKAVSNPLRFRILKLLNDNWMCVCVIAVALEQDQTLISHHLRILRPLGLIESRREGKMRFYRTNSKVIKEYLSRIAGEFS